MEELFVNITVHKSHDDRLVVVITDSNVRFPFKRNRLRCVRCVNENRKKRNFHAKNEIFTQQTQAPANRNVRSKQWQP